MPENSEQGSPLISAEKVAAVLQPTQVQLTAVDSQQQQQTKKKPTIAELGPKEYCWGTGRRKAAIARVRVRQGSGKIIVNNKELDNFFPRLQDQQGVKAPLVASDSLDRYDIFIKVHGGGITGQAGAAKLGMARALAMGAPETFGALRDAGLLTRDSRMVERKKYGRKKARKSFQFSKR